MTNVVPEEEEAKGASWLLGATSDPTRTHNAAKRSPKRK